MSVFIPGIPAPQGSAKAFPRRGGGVIVTHDNKHTVPWRVQIRSALYAWRPLLRLGRVQIPAGPVVVRLEFVMPRRVREPKVLQAHTRKPDLDKLVRAALDAMTGVLYKDDAQVVGVEASKRTANVGEMPGLHVSWRPPWTVAGEPFGVGVTGRPGVSDGLQTLSGGAR